MYDSGPVAAVRCDDPGGIGMRLRKVTASAVLCTALLASACGDDDSEGATATTTTTAAAAATTSTVGQGGATTSTMAEDGRSGLVTLGDDGRLQPLSACEGENVADQRSGVTESTINVAPLNYDVKVLADIGFSASDRSFTETIATFLEGVNEQGGVCGRTYDVQRIEYDVIRNEFGQACIRATEDRRNLAVLSVASQNSTCLTDAGTVVITGGDWTVASMAQTDGLLFNRNPSADAMYRATVQYAEDSGQLDGTVGVFYGGIDPMAVQAMEAIILPRLDELGVDHVPFRTDFSGPSDPQGNAVILAAATQFASASVDTVLSFVQNTNIVALQLELEAQGARPHFLSMPIGGNTANTLFAEAYGAQEISDGMEFVGQTVAPNELTGDDPVVRSCHEQWTEMTGEEVEPATYDYVIVMFACITVDQLTAAALAGRRDAERRDPVGRARAAARARIAAVPRRGGVVAGGPPRERDVHRAHLPRRHR
jgi:hypothetical protein